MDPNHENGVSKQAFTVYKSLYIRGVHYKLYWKPLRRKTQIVALE